MIRLAQFNPQSVALGSIEYRDDLIFQFGDRDRFLPFDSSEIVGDDLVRLVFDYQLWGRVGFEFDFSATLGNVSVIAPVFYDLDAPSFVETGESITIDTSDWSWGDARIVASGPSYSAEIAFVAEFLFATINEKVEFAPDSIFAGVTDLYTDLPDIFATEGFSEGGVAPIREVLYQLTPDNPPSTSFDFAGVDMTASLPGQFGAVTDPLRDFPSDGSLRAFSISDPIFTASYGLSDLLAAVGHPVLGAVSSGSLGLTVDADFEYADLFANLEWNIDWTLLDMDVEVSVVLVAEYIFKPTKVFVDILNTQSNVTERVDLGQSATFAGVNTPADVGFEVSYGMQGELHARYGIAPTLAFPFTIGEFNVDGPGQLDANFGPLMQEQLPYEPFVGAPIWLTATDPRQLNFTAPTETFEVDVIDVVSGGGGTPGVADPLVSLSGNTSTTEGGFLRFTVSLDKTSTSNVVVSYGATAITAEAGDYIVPPGSVTIAAGTLSASFDITSRQDADFDDESILVALTAASNAVVGSQAALVATIRDDDADDSGTPPPPPANRPILNTIINDTVDEGETLEFEFRLDRVAQRDVTVTYRVQADTAEPGDFAAPSGVVVIAAGDRSAFVTVATNLDDDGDTDRVKVSVVALDGADLANNPPVGTGTIRDIYTAPLADPTLVSISDASAGEGDDLVFLVSLDGPAREPVSISFAVEELTAENTDWTPIGNYSVTIPSGQSQGEIRVGTLQDSDTRDETLEVQITSASNVQSILDDTAIGTIVDDDEAILPVVTVGAATMQEGGQVNIPIGLIDNPRNLSVSIDYSLVSGTATAGRDFVAQSGTIDLISDDTDRLFGVVSIEDTEVEGTEEFFFQIDSITGGTAERTRTPITIVDDDSGFGPAFGFGFEMGQNPVASEGSTVRFDFDRFTVSGPNGSQSGDFVGSAALNYEIVGVDPAEIVSVTSHFYQPTFNSGGQRNGQEFEQITTLGNSGVLPVDAVLLDMPLFNNFFYVTVQLADDAEYTGSRDARIEATIASDGGQDAWIFSTGREAFTIEDNDPLPPPSVNLGGASGVEGDTIVVPVLLEYQTETDLTLAWRVVPDNGNGVGDFTGYTGTVSIAAGDAEGAIVLESVDDLTREGTEGFLVDLTHVTQGAADIERAGARVTVLDNEPDGLQIAETGTVALGHLDKSITLSRSYEAPVVIAYVATELGVEPVNVRVSAVSGDQMRLRLQEPNHLNGTHRAETVHYLVVEAGTHVLPNGALLEAGTLSTGRLSGAGFEAVGFDAEFDAAPVVLSQVQTVNGTDFVTTRQRDTDADGFEITLQEEEANNGGLHAVERVGWVAMEAGTGTGGGLTWAALRAGGITDAGAAVPFGIDLGPDALALAQLSSFNGADPAWARGDGVTATGLTVSAEEDTSADVETGHAGESVDVFAFSDAGPLSAAPRQVVLETGTTTLTDAAKTLTLQHSFDDPVVVAFVMTERGADPVNVRVMERAGDQLTVRLQEPNNIDGGHTVEEVSYMVVEAGSWLLPDGTKLEAGTLQTNTLSSQGFEAVNFAAAFDKAPVVLSQVQTASGADFVTTRQRDTNASGFEIAMQEEEALNGGAHAVETLGYVAVEAGTGTADGVSWVARVAGGVSHLGSTVGFGTNLGPSAGAVAQLLGFAGPDPAWARGDGVTGTGLTVSAEEDTSADAETNHIPEPLAVFAFSDAGVVEGYDTGLLI